MLIRYEYDLFRNNNLLLARNDLQLTHFDQYIAVFSTNMVFVAYLLENAILVLSWGGAFVLYVYAPPCTGKNNGFPFLDILGY